jgi:hypothetical protein
MSFNLTDLALESALTLISDIAEVSKVSFSTLESLVRPRLAPAALGHTLKLNFCDVHRLLKTTEV